MRARTMLTCAESSQGNIGGDITDLLLSSLQRKYVDEEGLLTVDQWANVRGNLRLPSAASDSPLDPAAAIKQAENTIAAKFDAYIVNRDVVDADGKEMKAIVVAVARSLARRAAQVSS